MSWVATGYLAGAIFLLIGEWGVRRPFPRLHCEACEFHPVRDLLADEPDSAQAVHR